ncbi:MAG: efflux RND transporter permease subunit [bacterium]
MNKENETATIADDGFLAWMAKNTVAANLLMMFLLFGGLIMTFQIHKEMMPEFEMDIVRVRVEYPGAGPEEVERGIVLPVEDAVQDISGIKEITSTAAENYGTVNLELLSGVDRQEVFQDIEQEVNRIQTFPDDAEDPRVQLQSSDRYVMQLGVYGETDEWTLRNLTESVRDRLEQHPEITRVELDNPPDYLLNLEIPETTLQAYGLTLGEVAGRVRNSSEDIPAGSVETSRGDLLLRVAERRELAEEYSQIPIITPTSGSVVRLGDLADVNDDFEQTNFLSRFNGQLALELSVYRVGNQTPVSVGDAVNEVLAELENEFPGKINFWISRSRSESYSQRISLLLRNGLLGLVLVFVVLTIFLEHRLAFWVMTGMVVSILGSFLFLPLFGVSFNMISMFAFLIVLGIVVDDAVVAGENIYNYREQGDSHLQASIKGVRDIATPVTFSILTNCTAFLPLLFVPGMMGKFFGPVPIVVIIVFLLSLVEALFILPAHLSHSGGEYTAFGRYLHSWQESFSVRFKKIIKNYFNPFLKLSLRHRYLTIAVALALLSLVVGYAASDRMAFKLMPEMVADEVRATAELPAESTLERAREVAGQLERSAEKIVERGGGKKLSEGIYTRIRGQNVEVEILLTDPDYRPLSVDEVANRWRRENGPISGLEQLNFSAATRGPGSRYQDLTVELSHPDIQKLEDAGQELVEQMSNLDPTRDVSHDFRGGPPQLDIQLTELGRNLSFSPEQIGRTVRNSFYGARARRFLRGENEIEVRARLPEKNLESEYQVENLQLRTPSGAYLTLEEVADIKRVEAFSQINRRDGRRVLTVSGDVVADDELAAVQSTLKSKIFPELENKFSGLNAGFSGRQQDIQESLNALTVGFLLALGGIYILLAVPFRSYLQPFVIMMAIPFGIFGAVIGHILLGYSLSIISVMGVVALSGVVVNDSLIMVDYANKQRSDNKAFNAITEAAQRRFRPILLTTFGGLAPMIFETSVQARMMIPMAISLGFGILFSTTIILVLVPCFYMMVEDLVSVMRTIF